MEDAVVGLVDAVDDPVPVVVCCDRFEIDAAAAAADFSISSNSRLKIDSKHPMR